MKNHLTTPTPDPAPEPLEAPEGLVDTEALLRAGLRVSSAGIGRASGGGAAPVDEKRLAAAVEPRGTVVSEPPVSLCSKVETTGIGAQANPAPLYPGKTGSVKTHGGKAESEEGWTRP